MCSQLLHIPRLACNVQVLCAARFWKLLLLLLQALLQTWMLRALSCLFQWSHPRCEMLFSTLGLCTLHLSGQCVFWLCLNQPVCSCAAGFPCSLCCCRPHGLGHERHGLCHVCAGGVLPAHPAHLLRHFLRWGAQLAQLAWMSV